MRPAPGADHTAPSPRRGATPSTHPTHPRAHLISYHCGVIHHRRARANDGEQRTKSAEFTAVEGSEDLKGAIDPAPTRALMTPGPGAVSARDHLFAGASSHHTYPPSTWRDTRSETGRWLIQASCPPPGRSVSCIGGLPAPGRTGRSLRAYHRTLCVRGFLPGAWRSSMITHHPAQSARCDARDRRVRLQRRLGHPPPPRPRPRLSRPRPWRRRPAASVAPEPVPGPPPGPTLKISVAHRSRHAELISGLQRESTAARGAVDAATRGVWAPREPPSIVPKGTPPEYKADIQQFVDVKFDVIVTIGFNMTAARSGRQGEPDDPFRGRRAESLDLRRSDRRARLDVRLQRG